MNTSNTPAHSAPSLSVFFPGYNDGATIASMDITAITTAKALTNDYEILVDNDGSSDSTGDVLEELRYR